MLGRDERAGVVYPSADEWVAAVHASDWDLMPLGSGVVVDARRVLTCAHVILSDDGEIRDQLWVSFPKAPIAAEDERRLVASVDVAYEPPIRDLAVLILDRDVPIEVEVAPLRCPKPSDMVGRQWWAFGFPEQDPIGDCADGVVGASLAHGWVRLDRGSQHLVRPGFSGGGLWSPDYDAVVGVVAHYGGDGDGRAITLHWADRSLPDQKLTSLADWSPQAAGEVALAEWGWSLSEDPEGVRHWRPRARGVSVDSEQGYRFRGRSHALNQIKNWLDRTLSDRRVLVVTGSPGVGKSAVLGRVVTTSDAAIRTLLPESDNAVRARLGSVACAVLAKAKTALEVATEIARAASARLPSEPGDLAPAIREVLDDRRGKRFNVIIDALDEAASPAQARAIIRKLVLPLVETCSDAGAQVIVGTRRQDDDGSLLEPFAAAQTVIDLDDPGYFAEDDLAAYALACLQLVGDERPGNPYADAANAGSVARRIAALSQGNFLLAGLIARAHGMYDENVADPAHLTVGPTVGAALGEYLERVSPVGGLSANQALTGLAFAEAPGLPARLWQLAIESLYGTRVQASELARFARSAAANFLVESGANHPTLLVFRLFHQALNDALMHARMQIASRQADELALTLAFANHGRRNGWENVPAYLLRSLPGHAAAAGLIDDLLTDDNYLLHADLRRLMLAARHASSREARHRTRLIGLTPEAAEAGSGERAALFSVTQALENMKPSHGQTAAAPYLARWAHAQSLGARAVLRNHIGSVHGVSAVSSKELQLLASVGGDATVRVWDLASNEQIAVMQGHRDWVRAVCSITLGEQELLASGGDDATVRVWNLASGEQLKVLQGHQGRIYSVCSVAAGGQYLLASAGGDATVRIWDLASGEQLKDLQGHQGAVYSVCSVVAGSEDLLATAGEDATVRVWDLASGEQLKVLRGHQGRVYSVCPVVAGGQELLASGGDDATVRIWDLASGEQLKVLRGRRGRVQSVCSVVAGGQELLATAGGDATVRVWDLASGKQITALRGHQGVVSALCPVTEGRRQSLASVGGDATVRVWDELASTEQTTVVEGHLGWVRAVCLITVGGQELLASGGDDATVRIWDLASGEQIRVLRGHLGRVYSMCSVVAGGQELLATAGGDATVRVWDLASGDQITALHGHQDWVRAVCPVVAGGRELLASCGDDATVRIWDLASGEQIRVLRGHLGRVYSMCSVVAGGQELLATAGGDATVRIWDLASGEQVTVLQGHQDLVRAVCSVTVSGRQLLASVSRDATVRIWDPHVATCLLTIPPRHPALAAVSTGTSIAIGLTAGILVIDLKIAL